MRDIGAEYNGTMTSTEKRLRERLAKGPPLLLDGATGTELERQGIPSELPLWSARAVIEAPQAVLAIHRAYVAAGAQALTAKVASERGVKVGRTSLKLRNPANAGPGWVTAWLRAQQGKPVAEIEAETERPGPQRGKKRVAFGVGV